MELKKIINIMPDDKFLDYYITMSESFLSNESSYLIFTNNEKLQYVKSNNQNLIILKSTQESYAQLSDYINENNILIFHSFNELHIRFIDSLPTIVKKIWIFWGSDGYGAIPSSKYMRINSFKLLYPNSIWGNIRFFKNLLSNFFVNKRNKNAISLIKKMDYCATWVDRDHGLAKKFNENIKQLYFNYYTNELMNFEGIKKTSLNKERIFLGNSANHTNNHIEALKFLYQNKFAGEIICPLSYGGENTYIDSIVRSGHEMFGERFLPLLGFMPLQEYQEIISSCGIVWMNHIRQQAAGNLLAAFCSGKIIVLDGRNPMIDTFSKWDLIFFKKEDLVNLDTIDDQLLANNRNVILKRMVINANKDFFIKIKSMLT